ncbi:MAG: hypothetical protein ACOH13_09765 [Flavobacteriales bacterium]
MRILVSSALLDICMAAVAQGFNVVDLPDNNGASAGVSVREVPEGYIVFSGAFDDSLVYRATTSLINQDGNLIWRHPWAEVSPSRFGFYDAASKALPDGGFLASVGVFLTDSVMWKAYRFNAQYDTIWTRTLGTWATVFPRPAAYLAGSFYYSALVVDTLNGQSKGQVMRLDTAGNILTIVEFPQIEYDVLTLAAGSGEDILLAGGRPNSGYPFQSVVMRLDTALNLLWSRNIVSSITGFTTCSSYVSKITHDEAGDIFVAGWLIDEADWPYTYPEFYVVKLAHSTGTVIWAQRLPLSITDFASLNDMECLPDGDFVTCGYLTPTDTTGLHGFIFRYMPDGQERWHRYYSFLHNQDAVHDLMDVEPTTDGGFVLTGTTQLSNSFPTVTWLLRLDSFGCLDPGCQSVGVNDLLVGLPEGSLKCSPVPAKDRISITFEPPPMILIRDRLRIVITDLEGRSMQENYMNGPFPITREVDVSQWPSGTYVVHVADGTRLLGSKKIIVQ